MGEEALLSACAWGEYLEAHARRILSAAISVDVLSAKELLNRIRSAALPDSFRLRDVYRNHWHLLASHEEAEKAAAVLVESDYLVARTESTGGRSTSRYQVNPKARA